MGARRGDYKLVWNRRQDGNAPAGGSAPTYHLFNVREDPEERENLAARDRGRRVELENVFRDGVSRARRDAASYRRGGVAPLTPEEIERLRELGYLDR